MRRGGEGRSGYGHPCSEETRKFLSESRLGENNPAFGKKQSKETIEKRLLSRLNNPKNKNMYKKRKIDHEKIAEKQRKTTYKITDPDNNVTITNNLKKYSEERGILKSGLKNNVRGNSIKYRGYTCRKIVFDKKGNMVEVYKYIRKPKTYKKYKIFFSNGDEEIVSHLPNYCRQHNICYEKLINSIYQQTRKHRKICVYENIKITKIE